MDRSFAEILLPKLSSWAADHHIAGADLARVYEMIDRYKSDSNQYRHEAQRPRVYMPDLASAPWYDPSAFSWYNHILANGQTIIDEYRNLRKQVELQEHPYGEAAVVGSWRMIPLFGYSGAHRENISIMPKTKEIISEIVTEEDRMLVYLSSLAPHTKIRPHCGPTNVHLRCHFGLSVPEKCWIKVGEESRAWQEGNCLVFDDSFLHEVENGSESIRDILILDFWHPDITPAERAGLRFILSVLSAAGVIDAR